MLVVVGCCWLLLVVGCCWLLLVVAGCCWLLLVVVVVVVVFFSFSFSSSCSSSATWLQAVVVGLLVVVFCICWFRMLALRYCFLAVFLSCLFAFFRFLCFASPSCSVRLRAEAEKIPPRSGKNIFGKRQVPWGPEPWLGLRLCFG